MRLENIRKGLMDDVRDCLSEYPEVKPSVMDYLTDLVDGAFHEAWRSGWEDGAGYVPQGEWRMAADLEHIYCSLCGYHVSPDRRSKHCPNCGGRMR